MFGLLLGKEGVPEDDDDDDDDVDDDEVEWEDVDVSDECGKCGGTGVRAKLMSGLQGQEGRAKMNLQPQLNIVCELHVTNFADIRDRSARAAN